ncbi:hypothetical protein SSPO_081180 [Streptomyces antimycoticus]|uniref:Uncharacterized protein n=1 Tax=Streptomyces antimycoticus TaxID=68175 RepID=A0A499UXK6_9ACTN|nr:hypothetical protein SSPO_081180 [Streptomyces antimycoticus]
MWFTGRFRGAATVLVLEPWQVTPFFPLVPDLPFPDAAGTSAVDFEPAAPGFASSWEDEPEADAVEEASADEPSLRMPSPSLHAVREKAATATVAAAVRRRVRERRMLDMWVSPFGTAVDVVLG